MRRESILFQQHPFDGLLELALLEVLEKWGVNREEICSTEEGLKIPDHAYPLEKMKKELNVLWGNRTGSLTVFRSFTDGQINVRYSRFKSEGFYFFPPFAGEASKNFMWHGSSFLVQPPHIEEESLIAYRHLLDTRDEQEKFRVIEGTTNSVQCGRTLLCTAAMMNHVVAVEQLCRAGANVLAIEHQNGNTALLWAIANSSIDAALLLLDPLVVIDKQMMADQLNQPCYEGRTPLILAVTKGWSHQDTSLKSHLYQSAVILQLLELGADVNCQDKQGRTALHYAFLHRDIEVIDALLAAGADISICDRKGHAPMDMLVMDYQQARFLLTEEVKAGMTCIDKNWLNPKPFFLALEKMVPQKPSETHKKITLG
ncbi:MAG: ankyrin repeat domain-containing protein [Legionella sp.]|nr:ankyrin repeat domain-containing protein [Legionella sp.]